MDRPGPAERSGLPPPDLWPDLVCSRPELRYPVELNLAEHLLAAGRAPGRRDATAVSFAGGWLSHAELRRRVLVCAAELVSRGVRPGSRVVIFIPNGPAFVIVWLAVQWLGAVGVSVPPVYRRREIAHIVDDSGADTAVCGDTLREVFDAALRDSDRRVTIVPVSDGSFRDDVEAPPPPCATRCHDAALITYIASVEGRPRGVVQTAASILATADTYARDVLQIGADDVCIGLTSLAWAYGLGALLVFPLRVGAATVLLESGLRALPAAIARSRATVLFGVPTLYRRLLRQPDLAASDLASLRRCVSAAEPLPADVAEEWRARTGHEILDGLGTTELAHIFISARPGSVQPGSIGSVVSGFEARIVDDRMRERPRGTEGQLAVRGPTGCLYWSDIAAQRRAVRDGWTLTGDICAEDVDGAFRHVRRVDDLIISGGHKIAPREVERALLAHADVVSARVFGAVDALRGSIPKAVVTARGTAKREGLAERLQAYLKSELAPYKCPREIEVAQDPV